MRTTTTALGALAIAATFGFGCGNTVIYSSGGAGGTTTADTGTGYPTSGTVNTTAAYTTAAYSTGDISPVTTGYGGAGGDGSGGYYSSSVASTDCEAWNDEPANQAVTIRFVNKGFQPVYLQNSCGNYQYKITGQSSQSDVSFNPDVSCLQTCQDLQTEPPFVCDGGFCGPAAFKLDAGATMQVTWSGQGLENDQMPSYCNYQGGDTSCPRIVDAVTQKYSVSVLGYSSCGNNQQPCHCDANGTCDNAPSGQSVTSNVATLSYPSQNTVDVVFDVCAFGCPD